MTSRKQSLRALVRSRGCSASKAWEEGTCGWWRAAAYDANGWLAVEVTTHKKRAALAGLRAVLEAMPARKAGKR